MIIAIILVSYSARSLELSRQKQLINGYSVYVTKNVQPSPKQMKGKLCHFIGNMLYLVPYFY